MTPFRQRWHQWNKWSVRATRQWRGSRFFIPWLDYRGIPWRGALKPLGREYGPKT